MTFNIFHEEINTSVVLKHMFQSNNKRVILDNTENSLFKLTFPNGFPLQDHFNRILQPCRLLLSQKDRSLRSLAHQSQELIVLEFRLLFRHILGEMRERLASVPDFLVESGNILVDGVLHGFSLRVRLNMSFFFFFCLLQIALFL